MLAGVVDLPLGTLAAVPGCIGDAPRIALFLPPAFFPHFVCFSSRDDSGNC
jgi:hypothetical protein